MRNLDASGYRDPLLDLINKLEQAYVLRCREHERAYLCPLMLHRIEILDQLTNYYKAKMHWKGYPIEHEGRLICPRCGNRIDHLTKFCGHCGIELDWIEWWNKEHKPDVPQHYFESELSWEELKRMDEQPIWVEVYHGERAWFLVFVDPDDDEKIFGIDAYGTKRQFNKNLWTNGTVKGYRHGRQHNA